MTILKSLIPLALLTALLLVACDQQTASKPLVIAEGNKATASFAVEGMTWPGWDKLVERALLKLPGVASANADKTTSSATVVYDKTIFKPEEINTLGRYKFSLVSTEEASGQSDASVSEAGDSSDDGALGSSDTSEAPSQFDLGDFSNMKPAEDAASDGQEDELPLLGGPDIDQ